MFPSNHNDAVAQGWQRRPDGSYGRQGQQLTNVRGRNKTRPQASSQNPQAGLQPQGGESKPQGNQSRPQQPQGGYAGVNYQTGINPNRDAINAGDVLSRAAKEARMAGGSGAAADFTRGQIANDRAQLKRGISLENAQQNMVEQANRSELFQAGLSMQADMMNKQAQMRASQAGMASDFMRTLIGSRSALMQSLMADSSPAR